MYIDKSFQLLSADNGKLAPDDTRRQDPAEGDAEFSDLFGAELESQEQQNATGTDKKSGQEVAALRSPQGPTTEQLQKDQILGEKAQLEKRLAETNPVEISLLEQSAAEKNHATTSADGQPVVGDRSRNHSDVVMQQLAALSADAAAESADISPSGIDDIGNEQATGQNPWLAIINQSHDFNAILSQTTSGASAKDPALTKTEALVAGLLGLPVTEPENTAAKSADAIAGLDATLLSEKDGNAKTSLTTDLSGAAAAESSAHSISLSDASLQSLATGETADKPGAESQKNAAEVGTLASVNNDKITRLPTEQVSLQQQFKTEQPDTTTSAALNIVADPGAENGKQNDLANNNTSASNAVSGLSSPLQTAAGAVTGQLNLTENKTGQSSETSPIDIELPIVVTPDEKAGAAAIAMTATAQAKNAPQSFAQFQKAANAAAAVVQKQQLQAEQMQSQPVQELAVQQTQRVAEMSTSLPGNHPDTAVTLTTLLQTERPIMAGSAMGSSTGQQQQQAASQLFAAKLHDQISSNEQPALQLLEPNAATQLKERVMFQVNQKIQSAEIKLAPEELGSMQIKVQLQQEQLSVQFVVQQAGAKEALEQQMPRLREMLEEQGMQLTDGQVSQQREGTEGQKQARQREPAVGQSSENDDEPRQQQAMVRVSDRMVDYYA